MPDIRDDFEIVKNYSIADLFCFVDEYYKSAKQSENKAYHFMATRMFVEVSAAIHEFAKSKV